MSLTILGDFNPDVYRKKYTREDLEGLRDKRQKTETATLKNILTMHGFVENNQIGSHIIYKHSVFPITHQLVIAHKSSDLAAINRNTANICLKVRDLWRKQEEKELKAALQKETTDRQTNGAYKPVKAYENLPNNFETFKHRGKHIVRHAKLQSIGIVVPSNDVSPLARDAYISDIKSRVGRVYQLLAKLENGYECTITYDRDGSLTIKMPTYMEELIIPEYLGQDDFLSTRGELESFMSHLEESDKERRNGLLSYIAETKERFKEYGCEGVKEEISTTEANTKYYAFYFQNVATSKVEWVKLKCSLQDRPYAGTFREFNDKSFAVSCTANGEAKHFGALLKKNFGLIAKPDKSKSKLTITHPFYPEINLTIANPDEIPTARRLANDPVLRRDDKKLTEAFEKAAQMRKETLEALSDCVKYVKDIGRKDVMCLTTLLVNLKDSPKLERLPNKNPKIKIGEEDEIRFRNKESREIINIKIIITDKENNASNLFCDMADVRKIAKAYEIDINDTSVLKEKLGIENSAMPEDVAVTQDGRLCIA